MRYYTMAPPSSLSGYIKCFWVLEGQASDALPYVHRAMADGCVELVFHYQGIFDELLSQGTRERSWTSGISGPSRYYRRFSIEQPFSIFGVYMYPFSVERFFKIPASAVCNSMPELYDLMGQEGKDLEEQVMLACNNATRFQLLTTFFEKKLQQLTDQPPGIFSSISYILQTRGQVNVDEMAQRSFLSVRQFERNFKQFAGFSPKLYTRIIRFQAAVQQYGNRAISLTDIAYRCGYYDQSHFIHDFKEFSGHHPRNYFLGNAEGTEWRNI